jgi:integrase
MTGALALADGRAGRESADRLELLTALIESPGFDPLFRPDVIQIPPGHPVFGWRCLVEGCECPQQAPRDWCSQHYQQWARLDPGRRDRARFVRTAGPVPPTIFVSTEPCRVGGCQRPARRVPSRLCRRHYAAWCGQDQPDSAVDLDQWVSGQEPFGSYGACEVACCVEPAAGPLGLCGTHEWRYAAAGRPGGARLPARWLVAFEERGLQVPVLFQGQALFRRWCHQALPLLRAGEINLLGLHPLVKAELKYGLFAHAQRRDHTRWWPNWFAAVLTGCRGLRSLDDFELGPPSACTTRVVKEMQTELRIIYTTPSGTREAGYLQLEHFGARIPGVTSKFDLTAISQRWLRDLLWDYLAIQLRSPNPPRSITCFYNLRRSCAELSSFLAVDAPGNGDDPGLLGEEQAQRFATDLRRRAGNQLPSLAMAHRVKPVPFTVTPRTCKVTLDTLRRILRWSLDPEAPGQIGPGREFIRAFTGGGAKLDRTRSPFTDDAARALADEDNLRRLAEIDVTDRGLRDAWETIIVTGRRAGEVLQLKLDCIGRHNGVPLLWHDQTKVGNYDQAIRIPENTYQRLQERQLKTLAQFERRFGRTPGRDERPRMALFPAASRNPRGEKPVSYGWFHRGFSSWVTGLDLGACVAHQARHTLATRLLKAGATLSRSNATWVMCPSG